MSEENLELIKAGFAAHNRADLDALVEVYRVSIRSGSKPSKPLSGMNSRTQRR